MTASSTDVNSAICIYFRPISADLIQLFVIINGEHICLQAAASIPENRQLFAIVDLFGMCKAVQVLPVKHSGRFRIILLFLILFFSLAVVNHL